MLNNSSKYSNKPPLASNNNRSTSSGGNNTIKVSINNVPTITTLDNMLYGQSLIAPQVTKSSSSINSLYSPSLSFSTLDLSFNSPLNKGKHEEHVYIYIHLLACLLF